MERPTMLLVSLLDSILGMRSLPSARDVATLLHRVKHEGDSFCTITLPALGSALEQGLAKGKLQPTDATGFRFNRQGTIPLFLGGLFELVFSLDGTLLESPDVSAIADIRMICGLLKKPKALCTEPRMRKAYSRFIEIESDLERFDDVCGSYNPLLRRISDLLWVPMFRGISPETFVSHHGPGATAERKSKNSRFAITTWNYRSLDTFPLDLHVIPNWGFADDLERVELLSDPAASQATEDLFYSQFYGKTYRWGNPLGNDNIVGGFEEPVRVIAVPKTKKGPRIIAIEPSHVQYMQQGVKDFLYAKLERYKLTRKSVHFTHQTLNRNAARLASLDGKMATLDLSDASDRVHNELVRNIFGSSAIWPYLQSCRSKYAKLPYNELPVKLRKFASMGSALCFPVEAMVFYTVIQCALHHYYKVTPSVRTLERFSDLIDVYGDDIIVPSEASAIVVQSLEAYGLKVNASKSFSTGRFRESCGGDYFNGSEITPVYLRTYIPDRTTAFDPTVAESLVATSNQLYRAGYWKTCQLLRDWIEDWLGYTIPKSSYEGPGLTFESFRFNTHLKWCAKHQGFV